ncbi:MAG: PTS ascorbate transporter subunit IIA, partial [Micrococcales bacterium 32-70-13]
SVVTLAEPVEFGHAHNDPVRVVIGLAGVAAGGHLEAVAQLANAFNDAAAIPALAAATTRDAVRTILAGGGIA